MSWLRVQKTNKKTQQKMETCNPGWNLWHRGWHPDWEVTPHSYAFPRKMLRYPTPNLNCQRLRGKLHPAESFHWAGAAVMVEGCTFPAFPQLPQLFPQARTDVLAISWQLRSHFSFPRFPFPLA